VNYQNLTIERVAEQFIIKTNLRETLINGDRRRKEIAKMSLVPKSLEYYKYKIKNNEVTRKRTVACFKVLQEKLVEFEAIFEQLKETTGVTNPDDISSILEVLEQSEELKLTYEKYNEKIDDLRAEKDSLAERLHMISVSQKEKEFVPQNQTVSSHTDDEDQIQHRISEMERIMQQYQNKFAKQNTIYSTCKLGIEQLRRTLKIGDEYSVESIDV
jgi:hypothetical protein